MKTATKRSGFPVGAVLLSAALVPTLVSAQLAAHNEAGVTWGHIHMNVVDVERHERIWIEHFGGAKVDMPLVSTIRLPGTILMLNERTPTGGTRGSAVDHIGFSVPDLDAFLARWRADGLEVEAEFEGFGGRAQAYVTMPGPTRVELLEEPGLEVPAEAHHVHLYTAGGAEEIRDWYTRLFSMNPRRRGAIAFTADVPGMNVSFNDVETAPAATRGRVLDHIGFEVVDLEAFVARLEAEGVTMDVPYRVIEEVGVGVAFFTDPSGVVVELTEGLDGN